MMLSGVSVEIEERGLGLAPPSNSGVCCAIGSSNDTANTLRSWGDINTMIATLGRSKMAELAAHALKGAGEVRTVTPAQTYADPGAVTATRVGSSTGTLDVSTSEPKDDYQVTVEITQTGGLGVGAFRVSLDGQDTWSPEIAIPSGGTYADAATGLAIEFDTGTFEDGDIHAFETTAPSSTLSQVLAAVDVAIEDRSFEYIHIVGAPAPSTSAVTPPGSGTPPAITVTGTPLGFYDVKVEITTGATLVSTNVRFKWSIDGGATYTTGVTGAATVVLTDTGLTLNFASGTYVTADVYSFTTYGPITAMASALASKMDSAEADKLYTFVVMELPEASDAILAKALQNIENKRVLCVADFCELQSEITTGVFKRPAAFAVSRRISTVDPDVSPAQVDLGGLKGVLSIYRDERKTPALTADRVTCLRTRTRSGFYVEDAVTLAPADSDFQILQNLRVMNLICASADAALELYVQKAIRVNAATGKILETAALAIEAFIAARIRVALGTMIDGLSVSVDRAENMLSTRTLKVRVRAVPHAYAKNVEASLAYNNPALQAV